MAKKRSKRSKRRKTKHLYTEEERQWLKDCVLPEYKDRASIGKQFNQKFGTKLSPEAVYGRAAVIQGKYKNKKQTFPSVSYVVIVDGEEVWKKNHEPKVVVEERKVRVIKRL